MKKAVFPIIIVLILLGVGYFMIMQQDQGDGINVNTNTQQPLESGSYSGMVTEVDLNAMAYDGPALITVKGEGNSQAMIAVPSMGLPLCQAFDRITSVGAIEPGDYVTVQGELDSEGNIVPCIDPAHHLTVTKTVRNTELGYQFSFPKGPDGYILFENNESTDADFVVGHALMNRAEYEALQASEGPREGPPSISLSVYRNPQKLSAFNWVDSKPLASNINLLVGEREEAVVAGANASKYTVDGLYPIETYIIAQGSYIFMLSGSYYDTNSQIYSDFQDIVNNFTFFPAEG